MDEAVLSYRATKIPAIVKAAKRIREKMYRLSAFQFQPIMDGIASVTKSQVNAGKINPKRF
jgi:hypothetical protein